MSAERLVAIVVALAACATHEARPTTLPQIVVLTGADAYYQVTLDLPPGAELKTPVIGSLPGQQLFSLRRDVIGRTVQWRSPDLAVELSSYWGQRDEREPRPCEAPGWKSIVEVDGGHIAACATKAGGITFARYWRSSTTDIVCTLAEGSESNLLTALATCLGMRVVREESTTRPAKRMWLPMVDENARQFNVEIDAPQHHRFFYPYLDRWNYVWLGGFLGPLVQIQMHTERPPAVLMDCPRDVKNRASLGEGAHECWDDEFFQVERYVWIGGRTVQCTIYDRTGSYREERDHLRAICASMRVVEAP